METIAEVKLLFFDTRRVMSAVDAATRKALSHFGGFVRAVARRSIRPAPGPSTPSTPPHSHAGLLKQHIYYAYEPTDTNVVIGPARFARRSPYGDTTVPEVEEYGGDVWRRETQDGRRQRKRHSYPARPFMHPAFEVAKQRLPDFWADSVKK